jgi:hypothetical protein
MSAGGPENPSKSGWWGGFTAPEPPAVGGAAPQPYFHAPVSPPGPADAINPTSVSQPNPSLIVICIIGLGAVIAVPAFISLVDGASLLHYAFATGSGDLVLAYAIDLAVVFLGIGLILRKEIARAIYLVVALLGLVGLVIQTPTYLDLSSAVSQRASTSISSTQSEIAALQANPAIPTAEKQRDIASLRLDLNTSQATIAGDYSVSRLVVEYLLMLTPLVFLTRPAVRREFS